MTVDTILLIVASFLVLAIFIIELVQVNIRKRRPTIGSIPVVFLLLGLFFAVLLTSRASELTAADWAQTLLMIGLVTVTAFYALSTAKQADASVEMAEEMREQRVMASRPYIIQKAVNEDGFSHFEVYNAGNGTAIEVEVILLDQWEKPLNGKREGFLRAGDTPINFYTTIPPDVANSTFYVVSEYQGILSHGLQPTWYQTKLPCKLSVTGSVIGGKLEFYEVPEEKRIGIFKSEFNNGSKPK